MNQPWFLDRFSKRIGYRYLRAKKSSSFLSLITAISIGGVAIGVLTLTVTLSVMQGFEAELKARLFQADAQIVATSKSGFYFDEDSKLYEALKVSSNQVTSVSEVLQTEAILKAGRKISGALLKGVSHNDLDWVKTKVVEWAPVEISDKNKENTIYIGQEMAFDLGVGSGEYVTLVSPVESDGPFGAVPRMKKFFIMGIYKTGVPEQELHTVFTTLNASEEFLAVTHKRTSYEIRLKDYDSARNIANVLKSQHDTYDFKTWEDLNSHLFRSLALERIAMFLLLSFIVVVASLNIMGTLIMSVIEKKKSLSILRTLGASPRQVRSIFIWKGFYIGLTGITVGASLSLLILYLLRHYPVIELPAFYYDRTLPVVFDPWAFAAIIVTTFVIVLFGAYFPSKKAALLTPVEGIRSRG